MATCEGGGDGQYDGQGVGRRPGGGTYMRLVGDSFKPEQSCRLARAQYLLFDDAAQAMTHEDKWL